MEHYEVLEKKVEYLRMLVQFDMLKLILAVLIWFFLRHILNRSEMLILGYMIDTAFIIAASIILIFISSNINKAVRAYKEYLKLMNQDRLRDKIYN